MSVQPTVAPHARLDRRTWLVVTIAAFAVAAAIGAVFAFTTAGSHSVPAVSPSRPAAATDAGGTSILSLTPMRLASGALGSGYALPSAHPLPSVVSVLASMDPQTRRYTQAIMALTFQQLAAGAAGQP